jgi:hypothetical protein
LNCIAVLDKRKTKAEAGAMGGKAIATSQMLRENPSHQKTAELLGIGSRKGRIRGK